MCNKQPKFIKLHQNTSEKNKGLYPEIEDIMSGTNYEAYKQKHSSMRYVASNRDLIGKKSKPNRDTKTLNK